MAFKTIVLSKQLHRASNYFAVTCDPTCSRTVKLTGDLQRSTSRFFTCNAVRCENGPPGFGIANNRSIACGQQFIVEILLDVITHIDGQQRQTSTLNALVKTIFLMKPNSTRQPLDRARTRFVNRNPRNHWGYRLDRFRGPDAAHSSNTNGYATFGTTPGTQLGVQGVIFAIADVVCTRVRRSAAFRFPAA